MSNSKQDKARDKYIASLIEHGDIIKIQAFDVLQELLTRRKLSPHAIKLLYLFLKLYRTPRSTMKEIEQFHGAKPLYAAIREESLRIKEHTNTVFFSINFNEYIRSWRELVAAGLIERVTVEKDYFDNEALYPPKETWEWKGNKTWKEVVRPTNHTLLPNPAMPSALIAGRMPLSKETTSTLPFINWSTVEVTLREFFLGRFFEHMEARE